MFTGIWLVGVIMAIVSVCVTLPDTEIWIRVVSAAPIITMQPTTAENQVVLPIWVFSCWFHDLLRMTSLPASESLYLILPLNKSNRSIPYLQKKKVRPEGR